MKKVVITLLSQFIAIVICAQAWTAVKDIPESLTFPVAVELNGNIHLIGGGGPSGATDLHLRYNPTTDLWDTLAPVPYLAQQPSGAVVNGKIFYFGGGFPNSGKPLTDNYVYDPGTDSWSAVANIPTNRVIHESVALKDSIYVMGGQPDKLRFELYSTNEDSWKSLNNLPDQHFWYGMVLNVKDTIYRFGGGAFGAPQKLAQRYDLQSDSWVSLTSMTDGLHAPAGAAIGDSIYIVGGFNHLGKVTDEVWIFDVNTKSYHKGLSLPNPRNYHSVVNVGNCIYAMGGNDATLEKSIVRHCLGDTAIDFTGIDERALNSKIEVLYHDGILQFHVQDPNGSMLNVQLFDLTGRKLLSTEIEINTSGEGELNLNSSGINFKGSLAIILGTYDEEVIKRKIVLD